MRWTILMPVPFAIVTAWACSFRTPVQRSPAVNVYSGYETKISGPAYLVVDEDLRSISRTVKPSSMECSAHDYPVDVGDAFLASIATTTESIFDQVVQDPRVPSVDQMKAANAKGYVYVKLDRFDPRLRFVPGFWTVTAIASADIVLDVSVRSATNEMLLNTTVGGSRTVEGSASCSNGPNVLSDAIFQTTREVMERYAERIANSQRVRAAFAAATDRPPNP